MKNRGNTRNERGGNKWKKNRTKKERKSRRDEE